MPTDREIVEGLMRMGMTPQAAGDKARDRIAAAQRSQRTRREGAPIDAADIGASDVLATVDATTTDAA